MSYQVMHHCALAHFECQRPVSSHLLTASTVPGLGSLGGHSPRGRGAPVRSGVLLKARGVGRQPCCA